MWVDGEDGTWVNTDHVAALRVPALPINERFPVQAFIAGTSVTFTINSGATYAEACDAARDLIAEIETVETDGVWEEDEQHHAVGDE